MVKEREAAAALRRVVVPRHIHERIVMHSAATLTGVGFGLGMGYGKPLWVGAAWYAAAFVGLHAAMIPVVAFAMTIAHRFRLWVRSIVEEELIRFDLHAYDRQLRRLLPHAGAAHREPDALQRAEIDANE